MVTGKYIAPISLEYLFRTSIKPRVNISIIWRVVLNSFDIINNGLEWKVGDRHLIRFGIDPWACSGDRFKLSQQVVNWLREEAT